MAQLEDRTRDRSTVGLAAGGKRSARPLSFRVIEQAHVLAFQHPMVAKPPRGFRGGVVLGDGEPDRLLRHTRRNVPIDSFDRTGESSQRLGGHHAYAGMTCNHFGHFMAEMVHRILPALRYDRQQNFVVAGTIGQSQNSFTLLPSFVQQVYRFLGLGPEHVHVMTRDTVVESLFVSESGSDLGGGPKEAYLDLLDEYTEPRLDELFGSVANHKRIYVSRSKLQMHGPLCGEKYLESALEAEGYEIFHPQDHPVSVQMERYRKADTIIFLEGSACHGTELLGRNAMKTCVMLTRRGESRWFDRVLHPRAQQYCKSPPCDYLGTMYTRPDGTEVHGKGVSVLQWDALVGFLRNVGAARLPASSKDDYMRIAGADFQRYIDASAGHRAFSPNADLKGMLVERFEAAKERM